MEKCPFCGAEIEKSKPAGTEATETIYKCGIRHHSAIGFLTYTRTSRCYEEEIAALKDQLADREERLALWRDYYKNGDYIIYVDEADSSIREALKAKGELAP